MFLIIDLWLLCRRMDRIQDGQVGFSIDEDSLGFIKKRDMNMVDVYRRNDYSNVMTDGEGFAWTTRDGV
jgi:hypothetical protein